MPTSTEPISLGSAAGQITGPITAELNYIRPDANKAPKVFYSGGSSPQTYSDEYAFMNAEIEDCRKTADQFTIHTNGFELANFPTQHSDFDDEQAIAKIRSGVEIGFEGKKYQTLPCKALSLDPPPIFPPRIKKIRDDRHGPTSWASITLREGKYRQVRKMTAAVGFPTLRLFRVRIGTVHLNAMKAGQVIEVDDFGDFYK